MSKNTQLIIVILLIIGAIGMVIAIWRNMRKQEKAWDKKQREEQDTGGTDIDNDYAPIRKKKKKIVMPVEMDKKLTFKRPGPCKGITWWNKNDAVRKHLEKKRISFVDFKIVSLEYVAYKGKDIRKKSEGYWLFTIEYAA